jgi:hypothetical protein
VTDQPEVVDLYAVAREVAKHQIREVSNDLVALMEWLEEEGEWSSSGELEKAANRLGNILEDMVRHP